MNAPLLYHYDYKYTLFTKEKGACIIIQTPFSHIYIDNLIISRITNGITETITPPKIIIG